MPILHGPSHGSRASKVNGAALMSPSSVVANPWTIVGGMKGQPENRSLKSEKAHSRVLPALVVDEVLQRAFLVFWILKSCIENLGFIEQVAMEA